MSDLTSQLSDLMNDFQHDADCESKINEWIDQLPDDQLLDALKKLNPYGVTLPVKKQKEETYSFSYTNMRLEFVKRLVTTGMIGFLFRQLKEYKVPEEIKPVEFEEYIRDPSVLNTPEGVKDTRTLRLYEEMRESQIERVAIWKFLKHIFDFDPDRHVSSALQTNTSDPSRKLVNTEAVKRAVRNRNTVTTSRGAKEYEATPEQVETDGVAPGTEIESDVFTTIPPLDTYNRFDRYLEEHYEEYMDCVNHLYGARPDVDFCLIIYDQHRDKAEAKAFKDQYMEQVIAPITNIDKNRWVALGPYRKNREKVDFFNRHTEVLKEMVDQRERDSHIASDVLKKRIKTKKLDNIKEAGPDDKAFLKHIKHNRPEIARMGGEHVTVNGSDDECPDDHVEVNVFTSKDGGREFKVHKIYNPVEAPVGVAADQPTSNNPQKRSANVEL